MPNKEFKLDEYQEEFGAFSGSDITAFILPQGDVTAAARTVKILEEIQYSQQASTKASQKQMYDEAEAAWASRNINIGVEDFDIYSLDGEAFTNKLIETARTREGEPEILPLLNLQSITISTYRSKNQVRALGHVNVVGLTRGSRTVAGTFILTELAKDSFWDILTVPIQDQSIGDNSKIKADQMRPFDIILMFASEYGNIAIKHVYGCEIVTNGIVYSIQDFYSENTISYIAQDVGPLTPISKYTNGELSLTEGTRLRNLVSNLRQDTFNQEYIQLKSSRNPFR